MQGLLKLRGPFDLSLLGFTVIVAQKGWMTNPIRVSGAYVEEYTRTIMILLYRVTRRGSQKKNPR